MSCKIKFAVVGLGHIGKRHAEMIRLNPDAELIAVCDILSKDQLGLGNLQERFFSSIEELFDAHLDIDVVNICTPNVYHAEYAIQALENGYHVVLEKPIALTRSDAERILYTSLSMSRDVFCVMQNRYSPPAVWLKDLVFKKSLGEIFMVQINCYWNRDENYYKAGNWHGDEKLDGGTLFTQFSHFIDIMYWLFGDITNIHGNFKDFNHSQLTDFEDSGVVTFDFVKGGMGVLNYSTAIWDKNYESSITIIGSQGTVRVAGQYMNEVTYCHVKDYVMPELPASNPPNDYGLYKGSAQNHHYIIQNVIEKLSGSGSITTNLLEGMKVTEIIERIYHVRDQHWKKKKK
ncbi:Gfo/Idh/MocA family protein [Microbacter margulisiae]|uniref:Putative dehydrogenase n=1 Tax=Microbacter margulisiae TaxID=1350067 RepID=A0A7W5H320_9PORP|nr:Gfo/Idh/MocA family oxidoreductase [Microbacter margulisiae]MBB3188031.1 putative dehydrogenase [Microbacter margulisiae]